jgi:hypothetical protein
MYINNDFENHFFLIAIVERDFSDKIVRPLINEIASTKPGKELLERITNIGRQFKIVSSNTTVTFPNLNLVQIEEEKPYFYVTMQKGEKFLVEGPRNVRLAHELIHLVHAYENPEAEKRRGETHTDDEMDTEEERLTIQGSNNFEKDNCCENSFLSALNYPIRINHDGPAISPPSLIDVIKTGALGTLKQILEKDPAQINFVGYCLEAEATTTLLSAAAFYNQTPIIDYLLNSHVNIHQEDEIGGPILAALKHDHKELAFSLAERGLDRNLRDRIQQTALDFLNRRPTSRFDIRSKPLLKLLSS